MRNKTFLAATMVVAIFLSACTTNSVSLDFTNAKGEVPQLGNLIFRFNKSLVNDSLINNWDSTEYVSFQPEIKGRFRWEGNDQLVFSPSQPLSPATTYKANINNDVLRYSEYNNIKNDDISFNTAPLQLNDAQVTWVLIDEGSRRAVPQINFVFNYAVKPDDIKDKLKIEVEGSRSDFAMQTISASNTIAVRLNSFKSEDKNYEAKIVLEKGLRPEKGKNSIQESIQTLLSIPSPYVLNINSVEAEHDGTEGVVRINTSQQLNGSNISSFIHFEPGINYTVEYNAFGVALRSDKFSAEDSYAITIDKGLKGNIGGVLKEEYNNSVAFGEIEANIRFTNSKAVYLSKNGGGKIEVKITNVPKVKLIISKIYENNLLMAQRNGYYPQDTDPQYASYTDGESDYMDVVLGDVVYTKEIDTRSLPKSGAGRILNISQFEDRLPEAKGIYHVKLRSTEDYWVEDNRFISLSDIGLIAKQGQDKLYVFTNSIKSAKSIDGVTVNVYGANNQLLGTAATNSDGVAEVPIAKKELSGYKPAMIIAKTESDFNYLPFNNTRVNTSRFDVGGKKGNATGLDAFIYAERDIYRPGERVNFSVLLRDRKWKSPGEIPIKMKFLLPNGKELKAFRRSLNDQGSVDGSVDISSAAITGSYLLEVYSSNDVMLASKNFMIEEFVPDRIKVTAKLNKNFLRPEDVVSLSINAVNFFGPLAANRAYEAEIQVKQKQFSPKNFKEYDFELANQQSFFDKELKEGKTDVNGNALESYTVPDMYKNIGLLQANFYTTVFDETGRPVSRSISADIYTQEIFHGIKDDGFYYYPLNQPVKFSLVSVNNNGAAVNATAKIKVIKHEYRTVLARSGSYFRYDSQQEDKLMMEKDLAIGNGTVFNYIPRSPGDYEIRVYRPGANAYISKKFYSYGSWGGDNSSFEVNTEGQIDIELDKEKYNSGDKTKILFKTPFSGRMLVTMETDHVVSYQYVDVNKRTASIEMKLNGDHVPNVYVTATLIKPHEISDIPLTVAHGFKNISIEEQERKIGVEIIAAKKIRSKTKQIVKVKAAPGSYITLAAVDNGVLQVTDFKTPDPYNYYYQKKALGVTAYDMYPLLFPELRTRLSSTGGDGELSMEKRVNPMPAKRFKIMSYWSGIKKANGSGVAEFEYDVPQFSGEIRLMAVAYKDEKFGSVEATTTVADPIVLSSSLPRFLSPGDTVQVPVTISNTTAKTASGQASLSVCNLKVVGSANQNISIAPNSEAKVVFNIVASPTINVAKVLINVSALEEKFNEETEISVRPPSTLQKLTGSGSIVGGKTQTISMPATDFIRGSSNYELVISRSPVAEIADQLKYLVQYPYGCTEQTISAAFPQLYFSDFSDLMNLGNDSKKNSVANVMEAIRKIKMRQLYNGAITLWDGEGTEDWWTTIYAAHFLIEARKAGFDVDNTLLETMLSFLINKLKSKQTINYYYNRNQQKKVAPKEVAYSLYVLSNANRSQVTAMNYYKSKPELLALDSRYLLSAAYAVSGDRRSFTSMLPRSFSGEESVQQTGGSFYSATRDEAIALNSLLDVDPGNAQIVSMANHVKSRLKNERYLNTQERAFSFLALGKLARATAKSNVTAEVKSGGKVIAKMNGADIKLGDEVLQNNNIELITKGNGRLYYSWQASGISASGAYKEEDNFIKVRRQFFDRNGNIISNNTFKQNDLIIVGITLEKAYSNTLENIVLTDLLPAGFEIENPRTKELPGMDWIKNSSEPVSLDVRDDRIHFFVDAVSPKQTYYYAVRAVSLGLFKQGPVSGDAMYNGEIHSYHGAQTIKIQ